MTLVIDARRIRRGGIGTRLRGVLKEFVRTERNMRVRLIGAPKSIEDAGVQGFAVTDCPPSMVPLGEWTGFSRLFRPGDVLYLPYPIIPSPYRGPVIVSVGNTRVFNARRKGYRIRRLIRQRQLRRADETASALLCDSECVRRDLVRLGFTRRAIAEVAYPGVDTSMFQPMPFSAVETTRRRYGLPDRFVLSVGKIQPSKNCDRLVRAVARIRREGYTGDLVFLELSQTGRSGVRRARMNGGPFIRLSGVSFRDMPSIYSAADLVVQVPFYDGFSLPILEAMACGTPIVASRTGGLPEAAGGAALMADPYDELDIASALHRVVSEPLLFRHLAASGRRRALLFPWSRTATAIWNAADRAAGAESEGLGVGG